MIDIFHRVINAISLILNVIAVLITLWGIVIALSEFLRKELSFKKDSVKSNKAISIRLGSYLVLALEFFIASDIIKTVATPTWESLGILAVIVIVRTVLSFFLTKEIDKG